MAFSFPFCFHNDRRPLPMVRRAELRIRGSEFVNLVSGPFNRPFSWLTGNLSRFWIFLDSLDSWSFIRCQKVWAPMILHALGNVLMGTGQALLLFAFQFPTGRMSKCRFRRVDRLPSGP